MQIFGGKKQTNFFKLQSNTLKQQLNGEKLDVGDLSAFDWAVSLCYFGVQCLGECWHGKDV